MITKGAGIPGTDTSYPEYVKVAVSYAKRFKPLLHTTNEGVVECAGPTCYVCATEANAGHS